MVTEVTRAVSGLPAGLPTYAVETLMCSLWSGYFGRPVEPDDDFFDLGGDSLAVLDIVPAAREHGLELRASQALRHPTPARLAEALTAPEPGRPAPRRLLDLVTAALDGGAAGEVAVGRELDEAAAGRPGLRDGAASGGAVEGAGGAEPPEAGAGRPLFVVHSDSHRAAEHAALLGFGLGRPVHGVRLPGLDGTVTDGPGVVRAAGRVAEAVQARQPGGPVALAGFGLGAVFAFEAACALSAAGRRVEPLVLVSPALPGAPVPPRSTLAAERVAVLGARFGLGDDDGPRELLERAHAAGWFTDVASAADLVAAQAARVELTAAVAGHRPGGFAGRALLAADATRLAAAEEVWRPALGQVEVCRLEHGLRSPAGALRDPRLAAALRKECGS